MDGYIYSVQSAMLILIMCRQLADLMGVNQQTFSDLVQRLENSSAQGGIDIRLNAEIISKEKSTLRALGLNTTDTDGPEVYYALMDMMRLHDKFLVRHIGGDDSGDTAVLLPKIVAVANKMHMPRQVWALKHSVGKRILKELPPKHLMKLLGYKTIDSFLKREPVGQIFAAIQFAENAQWQKKFYLKYKTFHPSDFESRRVEIGYADSPRWRRASKVFVESSHQNIVASNDMGSIVVFPMPVEKMEGIAIMGLALIFHYVSELRACSTYVKLQQVQSDFGSVIHRIYTADDGMHFTLADQKIHWNTIHKHIGNNIGSSLLSLFESHLSADDFEWKKAESILMRLEPALHFWEGLDYVGVVKGETTISFNILDVATNYVNSNSYDNQVFHHMQSSLMSQIYERYLGHSAIEAQLLEQLDSEVTNEDNFSFEMATA